MLLTKISTSFPEMSIALFMACLSLCSFAMTPQEWLEIAKGDETMVKYYGLLLDQNGKPVRGAKVIYKIKRVALIIPLETSGSVKTGRDGRFTIRGMKASQLYISDVTLKGYEFTRHLQPHENVSVEFRKSRTGFHHPDKKNPVVLRIRRKNSDAVFLMRSGFGLHLKPDIPNYWCGCDLAKSWVVDSESPTDYYPDVRMTGSYDATAKAWTVTMETQGEESGIQILDEMLYEAPADGYYKELTLTFYCADKLIEKKFLYLRLRDCGMYARVKCEIFVRENGITIDAASEETLINPFGDRCLEALEFDGEHYDCYLEMKKQTLRAMKEQKLLPRPDFKQWIKEGKAKY